MESFSAHRLRIFAEVQRTIELSEFNVRAKSRVVSSPLV
jgi:hypothetical protein